MSHGLTLTHAALSCIRSFLLIRCLCSSHLWHCQKLLRYTCNEYLVLIVISEATNLTCKQNFNNHILIYCLKNIRWLHFSLLNNRIQLSLMAWERHMFEMVWLLYNILFGSIIRLVERHYGKYVVCLLFWFSLHMLHLTKFLRCHIRSQAIILENMNNQIWACFFLLSLPCP